MKVCFIPPPNTKSIGYGDKWLLRVLRKKEVEYEILKFNTTLSLGLARIAHGLFVRKNVSYNSVKHITDGHIGYVLHFIKNSSKTVTILYDVAHSLSKFVSPLSQLEFKISLLGLKRSEAIVVPSQSTKKSLIALGFKPEKVKVVPLGVDHSLFRPFSQKERKFLREKICNKLGINEDEKIILYVGGEYKRKNIPTLLKAIKYLLEVRKLKIKFVKVGGILEKSGMKNIELERKLGIKKYVIRIPHVPTKELVKYYNIADLFVFPSLYEGFGLPNLEALSCGCPVVTTNVASIPEVVGDCAIMVKNPLDWKELAENIEEVLKNDSLRKKLIKNGIKHSQKFSWEKYANDIYEIYEEIW